MGIRIFPLRRQVEDVEQSILCAHATSRGASIPLTRIESCSTAVAEPIGFSAGFHAASPLVRRVSLLIHDASEQFTSA